jgi:hypothetical protein
MVLSDIYKIWHDVSTKHAGIDSFKLPLLVGTIDSFKLTFIERNGATLIVLIGKLFYLS